VAGGHLGVIGPHIFLPFLLNEASLKLLSNSNMTHHSVARGFS